MADIHRRLFAFQMHFPEWKGFHLIEISPKFGSKAQLENTLALI